MVVELDIKIHKIGELIIESIPQLSSYFIFKHQISIRFFYKKHQILTSIPSRERTNAMGWLREQKRGPPWKHGWTEQTIASMSLPPLPILIIFFIVVFLLYLSFSINLTKQMDRTMAGMKLFLLLIPVAIIFLAQWISVKGKLVIPLLNTDHDAVHRASGSPWGVAVVVVLLLVLLSYQSSLHSKWFPWSSYS